jgi:hypothetical protein
MTTCKLCAQEPMHGRNYCNEHHLERRRWREKEANRIYSRNRSREATRAINVKSRYGITIGQVDDLLAAQGGGCAICHTKESGTRDWCVDHDHACCPPIRNLHACGKCVRGIVCYNCNNMLGYSIDSPETLMAGVTYLMSRVDVLAEMA